MIREAQLYECTAAGVTRLFVSLFRADRSALHRAEGKAWAAAAAMDAAAAATTSAAAVPPAADQPNVRRQRRRGRGHAGAREERQAAACSALRLQRSNDTH